MEPQHASTETSIPDDVAWLHERLIIDLGREVRRRDETHSELRAEAETYRQSAISLRRLPRLHEYTNDILPHDIGHLNFCVEDLGDLLLDLQELLTTRHLFDHRYRPHQLLPEETKNILKEVADTRTNNIETGLVGVREIYMAMRDVEAVLKETSHLSCANEAAMDDAYRKLEDVTECIDCWMREMNSRKNGWLEDGGRW